MPASPNADERSQQIGRRSFLAASAATSVTSSLMGEQGDRQTSSRRAHEHHQIVKVILQGGPSQIDLWDPKPNAVGEIRGSFRPICTNITGIQISECLPQIATMMDRFTIVRSISGSHGSHDLTQSQIGSSTTPSDPSSTAGTFQEAESLLSAGASDIVLKFGNWDHHQQLAGNIKSIAAQLDQQLCRFIQSLANTRRLEETTVLVWGEFGRSPRINPDGGRDHWPAVNSAIIAGGPSARGNAWGSTSDDGSDIIDHAISMNDLIQQCSQSPSVGLV